MAKNNYHNIEIEMLPVTWRYENNNQIFARFATFPGGDRPKVADTNY